MSTAMIKALHEHTYNEGLQECSCGRAFAGSLTFYDYCGQLSGEIGVLDDPESTRAAMSAIVDHQHWATSVSGNPICLCGDEALDRDLVRHIADRIDRAVTMEGLKL